MGNIGRPKIECRGDGVGSLRDFSYQGIPSNLSSDAAVLRDDFGETTKRILHALMSKWLVQLDECCRTDHIGVLQHAKLACWFFGHQVPRSCVSADQRADRISATKAW